MYYVWKHTGEWRRSGDFAEVYKHHWAWTQRYRKKAEAIEKCDSLTCHGVVTKASAVAEARCHDNGKEPAGRPSNLAGIPLAGSPLEDDR